jgi:hypothetical protein
MALAQGRPDASCENTCNMNARELLLPLLKRKVDDDDNSAHVGFSRPVGWGAWQKAERGPAPTDSYRAGVYKGCKDIRARRDDQVRNQQSLLSVKEKSYFVMIKDILGAASDASQVGRSNPAEFFRSSFTELRDCIGGCLEQKHRRNATPICQKDQLLSISMALATPAARSTASPSH